MKVAISICTRKRPEFLRRALTSLNDLDIPPGVTIVVTVIENGEGSRAVEALELIDRFETEHRYSEEPGLVTARNLALDAADEIGADWVAFMDDDQVADSDWIKEFKKGADFFPETRLFAGPYTFIFEEEPKGWIMPFQFGVIDFGRRTSFVAGGNAFIHKDVFSQSKMNERFDPDYQFSGGEDTEYFMRLKRKERITRWLPDAIVYEYVPAERLTSDYIIERSRRSQANITRIRHKLRTPFRAYVADVRLMLRAVVWTLIGLLKGLLLLPLYTRGATLTFGGAFMQCTVILGILDAWLGRRPDPYLTVDGQ